MSPMVPAAPPVSMDPQPPRLTFGQYIRHLRESRGWTQAQLQVESGLGAGTISKIENDETNRTKETTDKLAAAFELSEAALLNGYEQFSRGPEPDPTHQPLRRITDRGLDPVVVRMAERMQRLPKFARHAVEGVIDAFEDLRDRILENDGDGRTEK